MIRFGMTLVGVMLLIIFGGLSPFPMLTPSGVQSRSSAPAPKQMRAARDTYSPVMEVLRPRRRRPSDEQLERLKRLPLEAVWGALERRQYRNCFVNGLQTTQPGRILVGRALTMRYLPVRPDLMEAVTTLAQEGDWSYRFGVRTVEEVQPGDVPVVELGGAVVWATHVGDVLTTGIRSRGAAGMVIDGGLRDLQEILQMKDFPVYYRGAHASYMADQVGVEWNVPVRIGGVTVLPGDVVMGDASGVLFFPPELIEEVIREAEETVCVEDFKREMMRGRKYRPRDIYPQMSPEVEKEFEQWRKSHPCGKSGGGDR